MNSICQAVANYQRARDMGLTFHAIDDNDLPFLTVLYASTRAEEVAQAGWDTKTATEFLQQQFEAQHAHYVKHYPDADWLVVALENIPIGRLYLERWPTQHRLIDIALLPEHQGKDFGIAMILDVMDEAKAADKALSLHVEKFNPARNIYLSLGFTVEEDKGVYDLMRWSR